MPPATTTIFDGLVGNVTDVSGPVDPATPLILSVSAINACGQSPFSPPVSLPAAAGPIPCVPDAQTMCLFDGRFTVRLTGQPPGGVVGPATVTRRFNDGGGFSFVNGSNVEDLFVRIDNRCPTAGAYGVTFNNRSGFPPPVGFELFVGDNQGSISRSYLHLPKDAVRVVRGHAELQLVPVSRATTAYQGSLRFVKARPLSAAGVSPPVQIMTPSLS